MTKESRLQRRQFLAGAVAAGPAFARTLTASPPAPAAAKTRQVWVEDHGADPTGSTSSSSALNAIASAYPAGDVEINFGPGRFILSETWTPSCSAIKGAGRGATVL